MAISIRNLENSFVRFGEAAPENCQWPGLENIPLPVFDSADIAFQFLVETETAEEANELCGLTNDMVLGIVSSCEDEDFLLEFTEKPTRYRVGPLLVLYNWEHGVPNFSSVVSIGDCFRIRVKHGEDLSECSNDFQRIADPCFTSVLDYGNEENAYGFLYCADASTLAEGDSSACQPLALSFINKAIIDIPYTQSLRDKYGDTPSVQVWHLVNGVPQIVIVEVSLDGFPPNMIHVDNGGPATGWVVIR